MRVRDPHTDLDVLRARLEDHTRIRGAQWQRTLAAQASPAEAPPESRASETPFDPPAGWPGPPDLPMPGRHASRAGARRPSFPLLSRVGFAPPQVAVVAVVAAIVLALAAWWVLRSQAQETTPASLPVTTAAPGEALTTGANGAPASATPNGAGGAEGSGDAATPATSATGEVVVHVDGEVVRPGVVVLPSGSRVADAIEAAGGALPEVDLAGVNLARVLTDGEQVLVGIEAPPGSQGAAGPPGAGGGAGGGEGGGLVNLNTADLSALDTLPGVGPVTAQSILEWREANGGFTSVDELVEVDGIGEATLARIAPHATV